MRNNVESQQQVGVRAGFEKGVVSPEHAGRVFHLILIRKNHDGFGMADGGGDHAGQGVRLKNIVLVQQGAPLAPSHIQGRVGGRADMPVDRTERQAEAGVGLGIMAQNGRRGGVRGRVVHRAAFPTGPGLARQRGQGPVQMFRSRIIDGQQHGQQRPGIRRPRLFPSGRVQFAPSVVRRAGQGRPGKRAAREQGSQQAQTGGFTAYALRLVGQAGAMLAQPAPRPARPPGGPERREHCPEGVNHARPRLPTGVGKTPPLGRRIYPD